VINPSGRPHSHRDLKRDEELCPDGLSACPISAFGTGFECVDTQEELENCGGCNSLGEGQDCTAIPGVAGVGCSNGKCVVLSCGEGYRMTSNGACTPALTFNQRSHHAKKRTSKATL